MELNRAMMRYFIKYARGKKFVRNQLFFFPSGPKRRTIRPCTICDGYDISLKYCGQYNILWKSG